MLLYHYTSHFHLRQIRLRGLSKGEVPITPSNLSNAVWLTNDRDPSGHGLSSGETINLRVVDAFGYRSERPVGTLNKRAVRITVKIPCCDRNLVHWPKWGKKRLDPDWYRILSETGGHKERTWWLYWGTIPVDWFKSIDILDPPDSSEQFLPEMVPEPSIAA